MNPVGLESNQYELVLGFFVFFKHIHLSFSCLVVSDSLQPHGLQHARLPCPLPSGSLLKHIYTYRHVCMD